MKLFSTTTGEEGLGFIFEFWSDIKYHPMTGEPLSIYCYPDDAVSLHDFQHDVMKKVIA